MSIRLRAAELRRVDKTIDAVILAGGFGTRLKSVSASTPKSLMPVNGKVFLDLLLERLSLLFIGRVILSLHYRAEDFAAHLESRRYEKPVLCHVEKTPAGTGGALADITASLSLSTPFLAVNGDTLSLICLADMLEGYEQADAEAMIGLTEIANDGRYGSVETTADKVVSFKEKTQAPKGWISNGHYLFSPALFAGRSGAFSLEGDLLPSLAKQNRLHCHKTHNDAFIDIGIPEDYYRLVETMKGGSAWASR